MENKGTKVLKDDFGEFGLKDEGSSEACKNHYGLLKNPCCSVSFILSITEDVNQFSKCALNPQRCLFPKAIIQMRSFIFPFLMDPLGALVTQIPCFFSPNLMNLYKLRKRQVIENARKDIQSAIQWLIRCSGIDS